MERWKGRVTREKKVGREEKECYIVSIRIKAADRNIPYHGGKKVGGRGTRPSINF